MAAWRGLFRVKGQDKAHVSDGDNTDTMNRQEYEEAMIQPAWKDLGEVDPAGGLPQPQKALGKRE